MLNLTLKVGGVLMLFCSRSSSLVARSIVRRYATGNSKLYTSSRLHGSLTPDDLTSPPVTPKTFDENFLIPPYSDPLPLETINLHRLDSKIKFKEAEHEYFYEGKKMDKSVTRLVEQFFEKFDDDKAIAAMKKGSRWPRAEYMQKNGTVWTDLQIKSYWSNIGLNARNRGTWMHYNIERFLNGFPTVSQDELPEMKQFMDFYEEVIAPQAIQPYRTEWRIAAPDHSLAGSVDFVGKIGAEYVIVDWKRSKKLFSSDGGSAFTKKCKAPLKHLDDNETSKYFLQLNVYRHILQTYYDIPISKMILASFHPTCDGYYVKEAPVMQQEMLAMLAHESSVAGGEALPSSFASSDTPSQPPTTTPATYVSKSIKESTISPPKTVRSQRPVM